MLLDSVSPYDPVVHPVDNGVVAVGLHQQRRPVEIYRCIVFLKIIRVRSYRLTKIIVGLYSLYIDLSRIGILIYQCLEGDERAIEDARFEPVIRY